ncbi:MAG: cytidine deaminase [Bryobacterales bacterium]|nr:cytidine deaminase [Bryobacterales bacterium]
MLTDAETDALVEAAAAARERAVATYSQFRVGAALLASDGTVVSGCNIEAANYSLTTCAERVALLKALSDGLRDFRAIAVVTDAPNLTPPCGSCRQLLWEYCGDIGVVLACMSHPGRREFSLTALLPEPFGRQFLV